MNSGLKYIAALVLGAVAFPWAALADEQAPAATSTLTNHEDRVSYAVGMSIANGLLKRNGIDVNWDVMNEAIKDVMAGRPTKLTEQEMQETVRAYQQELQAKREEARRKLIETNRAEGESFLAVNKQKPGVKIQEVKLPDGTTNELQYKVITEGHGESPKPGDTVVYSLDARLPNGKPVESFKDRKGTLSHLREPGIREALQLMKPGAKWEITVPASLAYGDYGDPRAGIEPGSAVQFDIELSNIETPQPLTSDIIMVPSAEQLKAGSNIITIKPEDLKKMTNAPPKNP